MAAAASVINLIVYIQDRIRASKLNRQLVAELEDRLQALSPVFNLSQTCLQHAHAFIRLERTLNQLSSLADVIVEQSAFWSFIFASSDRRHLEKFKDPNTLCVSDLNLILSLESFSLQTQQAGVSTQIFEAQKEQRALSQETTEAVRQLSAGFDGRNSAHDFVLTNQQARRFYNKYYRRKSSLPWSEFLESFKL
jgi:hypothetical protein